MWLFLRLNETRCQYFEILMVNLVGSMSVVMVPGCISMIFFTVASPRPAPFIFVVNNDSKILFVIFESILHHETYMIIPH